MANLKERWLPIPHSHNYAVSNIGNVKSLKSGKVMKMFRRYYFRKDGSKKEDAVTIVLSTGTFLVHRLVMAAFKPNSDKSLTVDHRDRDVFNNRLRNLRWATVAQQVKNSPRYHASKIEKRKITIKELNFIYLRNKTETLTQIAKEYNIPPADIGKLLAYMHPCY